MELIKFENIINKGNEVTSPAEVKHWKLDEPEILGNEANPKGSFGTNIPSVGSQSVSMVKGVEYINDPTMLAKFDPLHKATQNNRVDASELVSTEHKMMPTESLPTMYDKAQIFEKSSNNIQNSLSMKLKNFIIKNDSFFDPKGIVPNNGKNHLTVKNPVPKYEKETFHPNIEGIHPMVNLPAGGSKDYIHSNIQNAEDAPIESNQLLSPNARKNATEKARKDEDQYADQNYNSEIGRAWRQAAVGDAKYRGFDGDIGEFKTKPKFNIEKDSGYYYGTNQEREDSRSHDLSQTSQDYNEHAPHYPPSGKENNIPNKENFRTRSTSEPLKINKNKYAKDPNMISQHQKPEERFQNIQNSEDVKPSDKLPGTQYFKIKDKNLTHTEKYNPSRYNINPEAEVFTPDNFKNKNKPAFIASIGNKEGKLQRAGNKELIENKYFTKPMGVMDYTLDTENIQNSVSDKINNFIGKFKKNPSAVSTPKTEWNQEAAKQAMNKYNELEQKHPPKYGVEGAFRDPPNVQKAITDKEWDKYLDTRLDNAIQRHKNKIGPEAWAKERAEFGAKIDRNIAASKLQNSERKQTNSMPKKVMSNVEKAAEQRHRVYLKPGEEAPTGYKKQIGENGAAFYYAKPYDAIRMEKPQSGPRGGKAGVSEAGDRASALKKKYPGIELHPINENSFEFEWAYDPKDGGKVETITGQGNIAEIDRKIEDEIRIRTQRRANLQSKSTSKKEPSIATKSLTQANLDSSISEEDTAVSDYTDRAKQALSEGNIKAAEAFKHIIPEEAKHKEEFKKISINPEVGNRIKPIEKDMNMMNPMPDSTNGELQKADPFTETKKLTPSKYISDSKGLGMTTVEESTPYDLTAENTSLNTLDEKNIQNMQKADLQYDFAAEQKLTAPEPKMNNTLKEITEAVGKPTINPAIIGKECGTMASGGFTPTCNGGAPISKKIKFFIGKMEKSNDFKYNPNLKRFSPEWKAQEKELWKRQRQELEDGGPVPSISNDKFVHEVKPGDFPENTEKAHTNFYDDYLGEGWKPEGPIEDTASKRSLNRQRVSENKGTGHASDSQPSIDSGAAPKRTTTPKLIPIEENETNDNEIKSKRHPRTSEWAGSGVERFAELKNPKYPEKTDPAVFFGGRAAEEKAKARSKQSKPWSAYAQEAMGLKSIELLEKMYGMIDYIEKSEPQNKIDLKLPIQKSFDACITNSFSPIEGRVIF